MKKIFILLFLVTSIAIANAQSSNRDEAHKQIEAQKVSFITQALDLSPEEAQLFWPLYNQCQKKEQEMETEMRSIHKSCKKQNNVKCSDSEILAKCDSVLRLEKDLVDLKIEYFNKYKKILPAQKVHRLLNIERDFNRKLLNRLGKNNEKKRMSH